ncbi:unnamed protein product [Discosporangium mesarthrocarpum]
MRLWPESATAELWRRLWAEEESFSSRVLLHVCTGPRAVGATAAAAGGRAFPRQSSVSKPSTPTGALKGALGQEKGENGESSAGGGGGVSVMPGGLGKGQGWGQGNLSRRMGFEINGVVVAPLGSLRKDGNYCIAELHLPPPGYGTGNRERSGVGSGGGGKRCRGGWSVAGLEFGELPPDAAGGRDAMRSGGEAS